MNHRIIARKPLVVLMTLIGLWATTEWVAAQPVATKTEIDSISYAQFVRGDLRGLQKTLKQARISEVDFFYLRLRAALLYSGSGRFEALYPHARRLMQFNPYDTLAQRLWFLSLHHTGRTCEQHRWLSNCDSATYRRLTGAGRGRTQPILQWEPLSITYGYLVEEGFSSRRNAAVLESGAIYTERTLQGPMSMFALATGARFATNHPGHSAYRWRTAHSIGFFRSNPVGAWEAADPALSNRSYARTYSVFSQQYHGSLEYAHGRSFRSTTGLLWGVFREESKFLTSEYLPDFSGLAPIDLVYQHTALLASLYSRYRIPRGELFASAGYGNLSGQPQLQLDGGGTWYPGGRSNLYLSIALSGLFQGSLDSIQMRPVVAPKFGTKIRGRWWAECEYLTRVGRERDSGARGLANYTRPLSFQTYNTVEPIVGIAGLAIYRYHGWGTVRLGYQQQVRETPFYSFRAVAPDQFSLTTTHQKHTNHFLNLTLSWKLKK